MMKTALSIIQSVRYRMNLSAPTTLISVTDPDELQMIHLLYAVCEELRQARCWPQLKRSHSFTTSASRTKYYLPADFYAPLLETHWNQTEDDRLIGPASDSGFTHYLYSGESSTEKFTWRVFGRDQNSAGGGGQFEINPTPSPALWVTATAYSVGDQVTSSGGNIYICSTAITESDTEPTGTTTAADDDGVWTYVSAWAGDTLSFEYITRSFLLPQNWAASTSYGASAYVNCNGNIYQKPTGTATSGTTAPSGTTTSSDGTITWTYISAAYETVLADTDLVVFDDDLVKLGLRAKWIEEKGGDYQAAADEFAAKIDAAVARYRGPYVGSMAGCEAKRSYSVTPRRGWSL